jgi:hypothetical protein
VDSNGFATDSAAVGQINIMKTTTYKNEDLDKILSEPAKVVSLNLKQPK